jgi:hypothetical protein
MLREYASIFKRRYGTRMRSRTQPAQDPSSPAGLVDGELDGGAFVAGLPEIAARFAPNALIAVTVATTQPIRVTFNPLRTRHDHLGLLHVVSGMP